MPISCLDYGFLVSDKIFSLFWQIEDCILVCKKCLSFATYCVSWTNIITGIHLKIMIMHNGCDFKGCLLIGAFDLHFISVVLLSFLLVELSFNCF